MQHATMRFLGMGLLWGEDTAPISLFYGGRHIEKRLFSGASHTGMARTKGGLMKK